MLLGKKRERTPTPSPKVDKSFKNDSDEEAPITIKKRKRIRLNPVDSDDSDVENKGNQMLILFSDLYLFINASSMHYSPFWKMQNSCLSLKARKMSQYFTKIKKEYNVNTLLIKSVINRYTTVDTSNNVTMILKKYVLRWYGFGENEWWNDKNDKKLLVNGKIGKEIM